MEITSCQIKRDPKLIPLWSSLVNRWHQLDDEAYCVAEATFRKKGFIGKPDLVIFTTTESSMNTDCLFSQSEKFSPSHFVHTLPNVRSLSFSLVLNWEGPLLCTSLGEHSLRTANELSKIHLKSKQVKNVMIVLVSRLDEVIKIDFIKNKE